MSGITDLAAKGRNGDNTLMHVSNDEVAGLNALARQSMGRELTTNPDTGLPEAFLFAPFLAPMVAGGLGVGGSALATGLAAGALGAAEAGARGMDDPLERGLYAGLTAGAMSGVGNALSNAAPTATAAGEAGTAAATATPDLSQSALSGGNTFSVTNPSAATPATMQGVSFNAPTAQSAMQTSSAPMSIRAPQTMTGPTPGSISMGGPQLAQTMPQPTTTAGDFSIGGSQYGEAPQMLEGAKNIFSDGPASEAARQQFMQQAKAPLTAGAVGLGGQAQLSARDKAKSAREESEAEKAAERMEAQNRIRSNYAAVGRSMPSAFGGEPLFQQGGIVGLPAGRQMMDSNQYFKGGMIAKVLDAAKSDEERLGDREPGSGSPRGLLQIMEEGGDSGMVGKLMQAIENRDRMQDSRTRVGQSDASVGRTQMAQGGYLDGGMLPGDGMSDDVPATIDGDQPAALSSGEFVVPADVVSHIGNGSSDAGAKELYAMMDRIREARTGQDRQAPEVDSRKMMPK